VTILHNTSSHPAGCTCAFHAGERLRAEVARLTAALATEKERVAWSERMRAEALLGFQKAEARASAAEAKVEGLREALRDLLGSHAAIYRAGAAFHETLPVVMKARALLPSDAPRDATAASPSTPETTR
jgi:hypothetical protein